MIIDLLLFNTNTQYLMKKLYFLFLMLLSATTFGQYYNFTVYNANSGLASNHVYDFKVSTSGTMWIATNNGLSKMVGTSFTNYTTSNSQIATNNLKNIAVTGTKVYASTFGNGIILYNGTTFTSYTTSNSQLPNNTASGIATDTAGNLWVGTASGLTKFNGTTWTTYAPTSVVGSNNVTSLAVDPSNNVWLTVNGMLLRFNGSTFTAVNDGAEKILKVTADAVYVDTFDGFAKMVNNQYTMYWTNDSCLASCAVEALGIDNTNKVWLGLQPCGNYSGGVQNFTGCTSYTSSNSGMPDNYVTSLYVVDSNVIWAGTAEEGLVKMTYSDTPPPCNQPTNLAAEIQQGGAVVNLTWTAPNPAPGQGYRYRYNTVNAAGGIESTTSETSAWIDGLQPGTTYYWWVASACDPVVWVLGGTFTTPVPIVTTCFKKVAAGTDFALALKTDGTLWAWGLNSSGQLGVGSTANKLTPVQVGTASDWKDVAAGESHVLAIKNNGTLWAWGANADGQLGISTTVAKNAPVQVGTATTWKNIAAGGYHSMAIKTDGTLWMWGRNTNSQLGDGTTTNRTAPVQIGTAIWQGIGAGQIHSLAIKTDGTLWAWGNNANGELGDGTATSRNTPTQIGTANNWKYVDGGFNFSIGSRTNGTLWTWGKNNNGQLGLGVAADKNVPTQVGTATTWDLVGAGYYHATATRTYGAIYGWGYNATGQAGNEGTTTLTSPWLITNSAGYLSVSNGGGSSYTVDSENHLFAWGKNDVGQLGDGTTVTDLQPYGAMPCPTALSNEEFTATNALKVFPNPVNDVLNLSYDSEITSVALYNLMGQEVLVKTFGASEASLNIAHLPAGAYLVRVATGSQVQTVKIIKN